MFSKSRKKIVLFTTLALVLFLAATLGVIFISNWVSVNRQNSEMLERYMGLYSLESPPGQNMPEPPGEGTPEVSAASEAEAGEGTPEVSAASEAEAGEGTPEVSDTPGVAGPPPDLETSGVAMTTAAAGGPLGLPPDDLETSGGGMSLEEPSTIYRLSSFYSVAFSPEGEVLAVDRGHSGLYTKEEIIETAREILKENRAAGYIPHLLYRVEQREGYTLVAFIDMTITDNSMWSLLIHTLITGAVAICILAAVSARLARRIIAPLEENDRKQKRFISDAGHELKTPVAVISANAEILERQVGRSDWLDNIKYENQRMGELVTGLLDLSHAENASVPMEPVDLSRLVEREVLPFESIAFEQGLMIESEIGQGIWVKGNPAQLRQLVSILVDNAIRHGKGSESVKIVFSADKKTALLAVTNRGEISQEHLDRLFDRFYRADESRTDTGSERHYGLGLSIAKAIAESHGGKIGAACENGEVRFKVALPRT